MSHILSSAPMFGAAAASLALFAPAALANGQDSSKDTSKGPPHPVAGAEGIDLPNGVTTRDWSKIRELIEADRHAFQESPGGFVTSNPRFRWTARFDGTSALIQPVKGDWCFGMALESFGFEGQLQEVSSPAFGTCAEGQTITYGWSEELSEWWINDERGFEHGFTVHRRPAQASAECGSPLTFQLRSLGSLEPRVNAARTGVSLHTDAGSRVLCYNGLTAYDADGVALTAWLEVEGRSVRICVDETHAEYPILVDPVVQDAYIKASNTDTNDRFGCSIAASGDTIIVGACIESSFATGVNGDQSDNSLQYAGAAYVFVRSGSTWTQQAYLKASNPDAVDEFGISVAISGDTAVVGAIGEDSNATGVDGDQLDNSKADSGAAYIFKRTGSSWVQEAYLKASNTDGGDFFGSSVAACGDTVVVGAREEESGSIIINSGQTSNTSSGAGAAYVFVRSGSSWTQQAYLKASNTDRFDSFGHSVSAAGDTIVVGAPGEDSNATGFNGNQSNNSVGASGAAYVFVRSGSSWTQQGYIKASNPGSSDAFGHAVAASGDSVLIGAWLEDSNATGVNGEELNSFALSSGAAYVFVRSGSTWAQEAYLKASNTDPGDFFGASVALVGNTAVLGAFGEDSNATGIDGNPSSSGAGGSGAAYIFVRSNGNWTQEAYVKASNTGTFDEFGRAVAASGEIVVIAAAKEDSDATGIGGDESSAAAINSGAVYVFEGVGSVGIPFCQATINSTGAKGNLEGSGSSSVANNDLTLVTMNLPPSTFGFYITSMTRAFVIQPGGSQGNLCLGVSIGRYVGPGQVQQSDGNGRFALLLDLPNTPQPTGAVSIQAGETWNFQAWYRDSNMTGPTSNFTNGLEVTFTM